MRALNGKPAVYEIDYFPPQDAGIFDKRAVERVGVPAAAAVEKAASHPEKETIIRWRYADAETAAALGFAKGRPVVYTRTCYLDGKDRVVLLNEQYIDSERYMIRTGGHELRLDETEENG